MPLSSSSGATRSGEEEKPWAGASGAMRRRTNGRSLRKRPKKCTPAEEKPCRSATGGSIPKPSALSTWTRPAEVGASRLS